MTTQGDVDATYKAIGEFVIIFQWIENRYREIGWFILDPERTQWPPMHLRRENNYELLEEATKLFVDLTNRYNLPGGAEKAAEMLELKDRFHDLRKYRNVLLHSTYVEIKAGGEVHGYLRSNAQVGVDPDSGELIHDQEAFSADSIYLKIQEYGGEVMRLNLSYTQLINWYPFARHGLLADP